MKKCFGLTVCLMLGFGAASQAEEKKVEAKGSNSSPTFKKGSIVLDTVTIAPSIDPDGKAAGWILGNFEASVGGIKGGLPMQSRIASITVPIQAKENEKVKVRFFIRGRVSKTGKGHGALMFQAGGKPTLIDVHKEGEFEQMIDNVVVANPANFRVSLLLFVERDTNNAEDGCFITVFSISAIIVDGKKSK